MIELQISVPDGKDYHWNWNQNLVLLSFKAPDYRMATLGDELPCRREYWLIYRGPGFLAIVSRDSAPHTPLLPPSPVSKLDRRHTGSLRKRDNLLTRKGGRGGEEPNHTTTGKAGPL